METILKIESFEGNNKSEGIEYDYDGWRVTTNEQVIYVVVSNMQDCCESWGYIASEDDFTYFIGTELLAIKLTDTARLTRSLKSVDLYIDGGGLVFVDFETNLGVFQLVVYNAHNGYYGHEAKVICEKFNYETVI